MKRNKLETLFNKNHISITKTTKYNPSEILTKGSGCITLSFIGQDTYRNGNWDKKVNDRDSKKYVSKLGFYYWKVDREKYKEKQKLTKVLRIKDKDVEYCLTYVSEFNGTKINKDIRPWLIVEGDKSIEDHFIFDLLKIVEDLFIYAENNINDNTIKKMKDEIFEDLFGDKNGIKFQTNDEKILSHGFDLKTSFRKM